MKRSMRAVSLVLVCCMLFASTAIFGVSAAETDVELGIRVSANELALGETLTVTFAVENSADISALKLAGVQATLTYDSSKLSYVADSFEMDGTFLSQSFTAADLDHVNDKTAGTVKFVAIASNLTTGYSGIEKIFTVKFTALSAISDTSALFTIDAEDVIIGNISAEAVTSSVEVVKASTASGGISDFVKNDADLTVAEPNSLRVGTTYLETPAVTGITQRTTVADFISGISATTAQVKVFNASGSEVSASSKIASGYIIKTYNSSNAVVDEAVAIIKGDVLADGTIDVYDALVTLRMVASSNKNNFTAVQLVSSDVLADSSVDVYDALIILRTVAAG